MLTYKLHITRTMIVEEPKTLFVFGDNFQRQGFGGQAVEMRGEPNSVGIPTKRSSNNYDTSFLSNFDYDEWSRESAPDLKRLREHQGPIVWPWHGIGTGLAQLQSRAPMIWHTLELFRLELDNKESSAV